MIYYKLTDRNGSTKRGMHWAVGKTNRATGKGKELCTDGYLHVYDTPEQAAFMRPAHVESYTRLFKARSRCKGITDGTKRGIKSCTVLEEVKLPELTTEQRVEIAIRASLLIYKEESYRKWTKGWLSGKDRSAYAAVHAAHAAADAARAADVAADAVHAARAAADAARAADVAADAAYAVAYAARAAVHAAKPIDLISIINQVKEK